MRSDRKRDVYIAIMVAAARGVGVNLSWEECADLAFDDAIATRAQNGLSKDEFTHPDGVHYLAKGWICIDPYRDRESYQGAIRDDQGRLA
jgi:hypothetical protein